MPRSGVLGHGGLVGWRQPLADDQLAVVLDELPPLASSNTSRSTPSVKPVRPTLRSLFFTLGILTAAGRRAEIARSAYRDSRGQIAG